MIWARLHWDVDAAARRISAASSRRRRRPPSEPCATSCASGPRAAAALPLRPLLLRADGRLLATLTDVQGIGSKALNRLAGVAPADGRRSRATASRSSACPACSRRAGRRRVLAEHPRQGRRGHRSAARGVGRRTSTTTPTSPTPTRSTASAAATSATLASFDPLAYGIPPVSVGRRAGPVARAASSPTTRSTDAGCADLPPEVRARTGDHARQGHLPERRQRDRRPARARRRARRSTLLKQLHPEYTDARARAAPRAS